MHGGASLERNGRFSALNCCYTALVYTEYIGRSVYRWCNRFLRKISTEFMPYDWINTSHGNTSALIGMLAKMAMLGMTSICTLLL